MRAIERLNWRRGFLPVALGAAVALGILSLRGVGSADAFFLVVSFVVICSYLGRTDLNNERGATSGIHFSIAQLLEFFLISAFLLSGFPMTWSLSLLREFTPVPPIYLSFYVVKVVLTIVSRDPRSKCEMKPRQVSYLSYSLIVVVSVIALVASGRVEPFSGSRLLNLLIVWFTIPTVTFFLDMQRTSHLSIRYLLWRSAFEIVFLIPLGSFVAVFLLTLLSIVTEQLGLFLFELPRISEPRYLPYPATVI